MPEYDDFAEPYLLWTVSPVPYRAIELYSFFNVLDFFCILVSGVKAGVRVP